MLKYDGGVDGQARVGRETVRVLSLVVGLSSHLNGSTARTEASTEAVLHAPIATVTILRRDIEAISRGPSDSDPQNEYPNDHKWPQYE